MKVGGIQGKSAVDLEVRKLREACEDFEALFIYMLLKEMRKTVNEENDLLGNFLGKEIYDAMYLDAISKEASRRGGLGIADMLYNQLKDKVFHKPSEKNKGCLYEDKNRPKQYSNNIRKDNRG